MRQEHLAPAGHAAVPRLRLTMQTRYRHWPRRMGMAKRWRSMPWAAGRDTDFGSWVDLSRCVVHLRWSMGRGERRGLAGMLEGQGHVAPECLHAPAQAHVARWHAEDLGAAALAQGVGAHTRAAGIMLKWISRYRAQELKHRYRAQKLKHTRLTGGAD